MSGLMTKLTLLQGSNTENTNCINEIKTPTVDPKCTKAENTAMPSNSLLRREFKISGQIGEPGQADKLTFVSLTHQIDPGIKRNYKETEIVDAVIVAISLHSSLRS